MKRIEEKRKRNTRIGIEIICKEEKKHCRCDKEEKKYETVEIKADYLFFRFTFRLDKIVTVCFSVSCGLIIFRRQ